MIVTLSGKKRAGKDVTADILVNKYGFTKISLASSLRELCSSVFNMEMNEFLDDDKKERAFSTPVILLEEHLGLMLDYIETEWKYPVSEETKIKLMLKLGMEMKHPRHILQLIGTELIRDCIKSDLLLDVAEARINQFDNVVVPDVRFSNERSFFKRVGALMCFIDRPTLQTIDAHISENDGGCLDEFGIVFKNDDSLSRFQIEVDSFFNSYLKRAKK